MEAQKKRTVNFSSDEKRILTELVLKYQECVENKRTDATTNAAKIKGWIRIAEEFNTISTFCHRTHTALKCCWENIKRQTKKDRADRKKNLFMTGGGKPSSPPPSNPASGAGTIVEVILGPALEGIPNIYDSDAGVDVLNEIMELNEPVETKKDDMTDIDHILSISKENNKNSQNMETTIEKPGTSKPLDDLHRKEELWESWTPRNLKRPLTDSLQSNDKEWLKRRRPKQDQCSSDMLMREKIELVKVLKKNAEEEGNLRLLILKEQLKQEEIKTKRLLDN